MSPDGFLPFADLLPEAMLLVSGEGVILAANRALLKQLGMAREQLVQRPLSEFTVTPAAAVSDYVRACARSRQLVLGSLVFTAHDGTPLPYRAEGAVVRPRTDTAPAVVLMRLLTKASAVSQFIALNQRIEQLGREIQRRQQVEEELRDQREALRVTLSSIGDAVIATDASGQITFMNPVAQALTGWKEEEACGRQLDAVFNIINEATRSGVESPVNKVLREGTIVGLANHTLLIARDGTERSIDDSGAPIFDADGQLIGVVLTFQDITERRTAERALWETEERLRLMIESVRDYAIFSLDPEGNITSWNTGAERVFGYSEAEILGRSGSVLFTPEDLARGEHQKELARAVETGRAEDERWHLRKDGRRIFCSGVTTPIRNDELQGFTKVARDVTERMRLQEELKKRVDELAEADRRKSEYLTMLAHELRNPLAPILNATQVLKVLAPIDPRLQRPQEIIERQVQHQARLIDDLLNVTRITHGKVELKREILDLVELVQRAAEDQRSVIEEASLVLRLQLPSAVVYVDGDRTRLKEVLDNLLQNAAKFTEPGGEVHVQVQPNPEQGQVSVTVRDTGMGIAPDLLPRVFDIFAQADRSLDRSRGGLGLGLALVKGLVELHGGSVRAESKGLGHGAQFTVVLPTVAPPPVEDAPETVAVPAAEARRILIVEDNRDAAETLAHLLELDSHTVEVAFSGPAGLEAARRFQPDVVLCDLGLPGMNGYHVAAELRRDPRTAAAFIVAVSGYGEAEDRRRTTAAGFDAHLVKPVDLTALRSLLARQP